MLVLIFMMVIVFIALAGLLWAGALFTQGYIYSEPQEDLLWRAPAAAAVLAGFLAFWCLINYLGAGSDTIEAPYDTLFQFNPSATKVVDKLWTVRGGQETLYTRGSTSAGRLEYVNALGQPWRREDSSGIAEAIVIEEGENKVRFEPRLNDGKFAPDAGQYPPYFEKDGSRVMEPMGQVTAFRWGLFIANLFLNFFHLALWFVCLWLIIRFQWTHALFGAVIIWLIMTLVIVPMLLNRALEAGRVRAGASPSARIEVLRPLTESA